MSNRNTIRRRVEPDYCSVGDAARLLGVGRSTVRRWISEGRLDARRLPSGNVRIPWRALDLPAYREDHDLVANRH